MLKWGGVLLNCEKGVFRDGAETQRARRQGLVHAKKIRKRKKNKSGDSIYSVDC